MNLRSLESKNADITADFSQQSIGIKELLASQYHKNLAPVEQPDLDTHAVLTNIIGAHRLSSLDPSKNYHFDLRHINAGSFDLVKIKWQGSFKLEQDPQLASYIIYIVFAGSLEQQINQDRAFCCSSDTATIISPLQSIESIASEQGEVLLIAIDLQSIGTAVEKLLHRALKQPVIFVNRIDLTCELGLSLKKFIQFLWEALTANNPTDFSSLVLGKFEKAFLACLIEGLPSNYSEELLYQTDGALAAHVRKAQAFIESHLDQDIKLRDIAVATGVCPRLLQKAFSHHCDCSPMQFIAQARLQQIRSELIQATTQIKIVDVMMHYQFTQSGKFAKQYQQLFGEKPSETLKRSIQIKQEKTPLWHQIDDTVADRVVGGSMISSQQIFIAECLRQTIEICLRSAD
jgi:AraC-like DNA-binding protein